MDSNIQIFKTNQGRDARLVPLDKPYKDGSIAFKVEVWDGDHWIVKVPKCRGFNDTIKTVQERY